MDDFISISLLSLAMLAGCYVAGIIPLAVNFSEVRNSQFCFCFCQLSEWLLESSDSCKGKLLP